jgi:hypothetical protein
LAVNKPPTRTWKVVYYVIRDWQQHRVAHFRQKPAEVVRVVFGKRTAQEAWL